MRNVLIVILFVMVMSNCSTKDSDIFVEPIDTPTTGPTELVITKSFNEIPLDGKSNPENGFARTYINEVIIKNL